MSRCRLIVPRGGRLRAALTGQANALFIPLDEALAALFTKSDYLFWFYRNLLIQNLP